MDHLIKEVIVWKLNWLVKIMVFSLLILSDNPFTLFQKISVCPHVVVWVMVFCVRLLWLWSIQLFIRIINTDTNLETDDGLDIIRKLEWCYVGSSSDVSLNVSAVMADGLMCAIVLHSDKSDNSGQWDPIRRVWDVTTTKSNVSNLK